MKGTEVKQLCLETQDLGKGKKKKKDLQTEPEKEGRGQIMKVLVSSVTHQKDTPASEKQSGEKR